MMRLFFGIEVKPGPDSLPLLPGHPIPEKNLHLTLLFLGEVSPETFARIQKVVNETVLPERFHASFGELGGFPSSTRARIIWRGVDEGQSQLKSLSGLLAGALKAQNIPADDRKFIPHMTLSRLPRSENITDLIQIPIKPHRFEVTEIVLFESRSGQYYPKVSWPLKSSSTSH